MAAARVGLLYSAVQVDTVNVTTIVAATTNAVAAGNTAFIAASARGATAGTATITGLPGDAVIETALNRSNTGSPAVSLWRCYFPSGMAASTSITITWDAANSRKCLQGVVWTGVANSNNQANAGANAADNSPTTGTTGASTTTSGVHVAAWGLNAALGTVTGTAGSDTEGTMTEQADQVVGASTFHYLYMEDNSVTAAHGSGETAVFTPVGTFSSWAGVQGIWDGAAVVAAPESYPLTTPGPWTEAPQGLFEDRNTFVTPPVVVVSNPPQRTLIGVGT